MSSDTASELLVRSKSSAVPECYGYGAGRGSKIRATLSSILRADYAAARLDPDATKRRDTIRDVLCSRLLPDVYDLRAQLEPLSHMEARTADGWVPFKDISFGYKSAMAWIVDMASRMFRRYPYSDNPLPESGEKLPLPAWVDVKVDLVNERDRWFGCVVIVNDLDYIRQWRVDQILASDLFGHQPLHAPEVETVLRERRELLRSGDLNESDGNRLREIHAVLDQVPTSANPADQKLLDTIRKAAAELGISVEP